MAWSPKMALVSPDRPQGVVENEDRRQQLGSFPRRGVTGCRSPHPSRIQVDRRGSRDLAQGQPCGHLCPREH